MKYVIELVLIIFWIVGIILAKGFWSTLAAAIIFPWAWYLSVEHIVLLNGWL